jgi:hypothetical protein
MGFSFGDLLDPFDLVDTGGSLAPSNVLGIGDNADDGLEAAAAAQQDAAAAQLQLGRENIEFLKEQGERAEERLQPFTDLGVNAIDPFINELFNVSEDGALAPRSGVLDEARDFLDPEAQVSFLEGNPLFEAAINRLNRNATARNAAGGRSGGGVINELFQNFLSTGSDFINNRFNQFGVVDALEGNFLNRLLTPINLGQASAAGQAAGIQNTGAQVSAGNQGIFNTLGNQGDIAASLAIQQQNLKNQQGQGLFNMLGGGLLGSGALSGGGIAGGGLSGAGLGALIFSDERLKEDIEFVGTDDDGLNVYKWKYKGDDVTHFGPMAQEVEEVNPDAVYTHQSGYKMVDMRAL